MSHQVMPLSSSSDRRTDNRVRVDMFLNQYVHDEETRILAVDVSECGLSLTRLAESVTRRVRVVGLEFELPGTGESIWAAAETRFEWLDDDFYHAGVRFVAMARKHVRLVRDWVYDRHNPVRTSSLHRFRQQQLMRPGDLRLH